MADKEPDAAELMAQMRAAFDQAKEGMKEIAATLGIYYKSLKEEGFNDEEAFALVVGWQQQMVANFKQDG